MKKVLLVALIASLTGPLLLDAQDNESTARAAAFAAAVESIMEKLSASMLAGDADAYISSWDDSAVKLPNEWEMQVGIENIKESIDHRFIISKYEIYDIEIIETHVDNNLGYVFGNYRAVYVVSGFKNDISGKYVTICRG